MTEPLKTERKLEPVACVRHGRLSWYIDNSLSAVDLETLQGEWVLCKVLDAEALLAQRDAQIAGLAAEAAALRKDAARLDWCERHAIEIEHDRDLDGSSVWGVMASNGTWSGSTLRAAIDNAIEAGGKQG